MPRRAPRGREPRPAWPGRGAGAASAPPPPEAGLVPRQPLSGLRAGARVHTSPRRPFPPTFREKTRRGTAPPSLVARLGHRGRSRAAPSSPLPPSARGVARARPRHRRELASPAVAPPRRRARVRVPPAGGSRRAHCRRRRRKTPPLFAPDTSIRTTRCAALPVRRGAGASSPCRLAPSTSCARETRARRGPAAPRARVSRLLRKPGRGAILTMSREPAPQASGGANRAPSSLVRFSGHGEGIARRQGSGGRVGVGVRV